jgi:hypothetical protein
MAGNLDDLATRLRQRSAKIPEMASEAAKEVASEVLGVLAYTTPVDTSQALSNWLVTLNDPATQKIAPYFPGVYGTTQGVSAQQTVNEGLYAMGAKKPGQPIYITNNQPYIVDLNNGSSKQEPAGFVQRAVLVGTRLLARYKFDTSK